MGYARAGFEVVGVDINPQKRYPFEFHQANALEYPLEGFDVIHASPPCQAYSKTQRIQDNKYPDLIPAIRERFKDLEIPWIIENVPGSPLQNPLVLCGLMFNLGVDRDRWFETNVSFLVDNHPPHSKPKTKMGRKPEEGKIIQVIGHFSGVDFARTAMGIDWMTGEELREAIPPAYTEYLGKQLIK